MGWDQLSPTMMMLLKSIDDEPMEQAKIAHLGAQNRHLDAQNRHYAESDRLMGAWHEMQAQLRQQQIDNQRESIESMARFREAGISSAKWRGANQIAKNVIEPWKQLIKTDSPEYNHFATRYLGRMQEAARALASAIVDQDQVGESNAEKGLAAIQQELLNDPAMRAYAQQAGKVLASRGSGGLSFDERWRLAMLGAATNAWAGQNRAIPVTDDIPGLNTGATYDQNLAKLLQALEQTYGPRAGHQGLVPGAGVPSATPPQPAPGANSPIPMIPSLEHSPLVPQGMNFGGRYYGNPFFPGGMPRLDLQSDPTPNIGVAPVSPPPQNGWHPPMADDDDPFMQRLRILQGFPR